MNFGDSPNYLSWLVVDLLLLSSEVTKKIITVATGEQFVVEGKLNDIPVRFGRSKAHLDFTVLPNVAFDVVIDRSTLIRLCSVLDLTREKMRCDCDGVQKSLLMVSGCTRPRKPTVVTNSTHITSDSDDLGSAF